MTMHIFIDLKNRELFLGETEKVENPWANRFVSHFLQSIILTIRLSNIYFVPNDGYSH